MDEPTFHVVLKPRPGVHPAEAWGRVRALVWQDAALRGLVAVKMWEEAVNENTPEAPCGAPRAMAGQPS